MGSMFNSTASKVMGMPGIGGKGKPSESTDRRPVLVNVTEQRAKARKVGRVNSILEDDGLGGAGKDGL